MLRVSLAKLDSERSERNEQHMKILKRVQDDGTPSAIRGRFFAGKHILVQF